MRCTLSRVQCIRFFVSLSIFSVVHILFSFDIFSFYVYCCSFWHHQRAIIYNSFSLYIIPSSMRLVL